MNVKKNDVFVFEKAHPGWTELKVLETPKPGSKVVSVAFLMPLEYWSERATGIIKLSALEKNYKKLEG